MVNEWIRMPTILESDCALVVAAFASTAEERLGVSRRREIGLDMIGYCFFRILSYIFTLSLESDTYINTYFFWIQARDECRLDSH